MSIGTVRSQDEQERLWGYVNDQWKAHPAHRVPPTPDEAIRGFKILYKVASGAKFPDRFVNIKITSGNRHTWRRGNTWYGKQAYLERKLTETALRRGFLDGKLKPKPKAPKPPVDKLAVAMERLEAREKVWATKLKRAQTAIAKMKKERRSLERKIEKRKESQI